MSGRLAGQTAWISGAASGIGAATARLFANEGAAIAVVDVRDDAGKRLVAELTETGCRAIYSHCDVSDGEQVRQSIESTVIAFGGLDTVVNCAGIVHVGLLHDYADDDWDRLMDINVKSIYYSLKHAYPHLRRNNRSYIVNVGSISSLVGQRATPAYTTSKGAVLSLTQSIALDYAAIGLRCNCVCPGITDTPMLRAHLNQTSDPDETLRKRVQRVPTNRALSPDDVARAILYLSCDDSNGVTGTSLVIDGGYLAAAEWDTADDSPDMRSNP